MVMMVFDVTEELFTNVRIKKIDHALKSAEKNIFVLEKRHRNTRRRSIISLMLNTRWAIKITNETKTSLKFNPFNFITKVIMDFHGHCFFSQTLKWSSIIWKVPINFIILNFLFCKRTQRSYVTLFCHSVDSFELKIKIIKLN